MIEIKIKLGPPQHGYFEYIPGANRLKELPDGPYVSQAEYKRRVREKIEILKGSFPNPFGILLTVIEDRQNALIAAVPSLDIDSSTRALEETLQAQGRQIFPPMEVVRQQ